MQQSLTITLPENVQHALDEFARREGVAPEVVVGQAVKEHLFLGKLRSSGARMSAKAKSQGIVTDQDVFDRVS